MLLLVDLLLLNLGQLGSQGLLTAQTVKGRHLWLLLDVHGLGDGRLLLLVKLGYTGQWDLLLGFPLGLGLLHLWWGLERLWVALGNVAEVGWWDERDVLRLIADSRRGHSLLCCLVRIGKTVRRGE